MYHIDNFQRDQENNTGTRWHCLVFANHIFLNRPYDQARQRKVSKMKEKNIANIKRELKSCKYLQRQAVLLEEIAENIDHIENIDQASVLLTAASKLENNALEMLHTCERIKSNALSLKHLIISKNEWKEEINDVRKKLGLDI